MHEHGRGERFPHVVLVDDYEPALRHLAELLPMYGVAVVGTADRGDVVLETLEEAGARRGGVDVVVMDVRMPGACGLEATRQVRAAFPAVQVILHSAYGDYLDSAAREAGAFAEIAKGVRPDVLVHAIRAACGVAEVTDELPDPAVMGMGR
jgi:DNA-binding NarL/FixJ family response regulator